MEKMTIGKGHESAYNILDIQMPKSITCSHVTSPPFQGTLQVMTSISSANQDALSTV